MQQGFKDHNRVQVDLKEWLYEVFKKFAMTPESISLLLLLF